MELQVGSIVEGKVNSITKFGAFVTLEGGRSGLVHISEIANTYVNDVNDHLAVGQTVKVLVLPSENGKLNLSIKRTESAPPRTSRAPRPMDRASGAEGERRERQPRPYSRPAQPAAGVEQTFEDKLKQFLSSSEGKMAELNRSMDSKRSRRRR